MHYNITKYIKTRGGCKRRYKIGGGGGGLWVNDKFIPICQPKHD